MQRKTKYLIAGGAVIVAISGIGAGAVSASG